MATKKIAKKKKAKKKVAKKKVAKKKISKKKLARKKTSKKKLTKKKPPSKKKSKTSASDRRKATTKVIKVDYLARVEGEGALLLRYRKDKVEEVRLKIFEPPRFFEAFLEGRDFSEAPDVTARICGICPVAYQMSAVHAMEKAIGLVLPQPLRLLRRLLYCGEWIESHILHIYMLHAPDFLGYPDVMTMARKHKKEVERSLRQKKRGNQIVSLLGGREIHPINVKVGGFYHLPPREKFQILLEELKVGREEAWQTLKFAASLEYPDFERQVEFVSLVHASDYPMSEGRICSTAGLDIGMSEYEDHFEEEHIPYSNALFSKLKTGGSYLVGPTARFNLNAERLSEVAQQGATEIGLTAPCYNPFKSLMVRAVEVLYAFDEAVRILESPLWPEQASVPAKVTQACRGEWATEAPRGLLYHRYELSKTGKICTAQIIPPTSQNQRTIEDDVRELVLANPKLSEDKMRHRCEQAIRNYDPCISCATHFLKIKKEVL